MPRRRSSSRATPTSSATEDGAVKITRVEPILVAIPYDHGGPKVQRHATGSHWDKQPILFVRGDTGEGITGWGEAFGHASSPVTITAVAEIVGKLAIGLDAGDIA